MPQLRTSALPKVPGLASRHGPRISLSVPLADHIVNIRRYFDSRLPTERLEAFRQQQPLHAPFLGFAINLSLVPENPTQPRCTCMIKAANLTPSKLIVP